MGKYLKEFKKGIMLENPTFVLVLGLCPTLAVSTTVENAIGMGASATFVLLGSNTIVSLIRRMIPERIRIPCFIVVIATFVTIIELFLKAYAPSLSKSLGIFVPLIVVNCIVLGRAEAFASKNSVLLSICDALGMGLGFTISLVVIAALRELIGNGTLLGYRVLIGYEPALFMILAPGALFTIGFLIGLIRWISRQESKIQSGGCHQL